MRNAYIEITINTSIKVIPTESRKIQKVGHSTLTISLPKEWTKDKNVKQGDIVFVAPETDGSLRIITSDLAVREEAEEYVINADVCNERLIERLIVGSYILGLDVIRITSTNRIKGECVEEVRGIVKRLIGLGILEENPKNILLQCSIDPTKFQMDMLIRRLSMITSTIYSEAMQALLEKNVDLAMDAISREDEADIIFFLATRLLVLARQKRDLAEKIGFSKIILIPCTCIIVQYLELIADYSESLAKVVINLEKHKVEISETTLQKIDHLSELTHNIFQKAVDCIFTKDLNTANSLIEMHEVLERRIEQEMYKLPQIPYLRTIVSTLSKIADKGAIIAKLAINTALMDSEKHIGELVNIRKHIRTAPLPHRRECCP